MPQPWTQPLTFLISVRYEKHVKTLVNEEVGPRTWTLWGLANKCYKSDNSSHALYWQSTLRAYILNTINHMISHYQALWLLASTCSRVLWSTTSIFYNVHVCEWGEGLYHSISVCHKHLHVTWPCGYSLCHPWWGVHPKLSPRWMFSSYPDGSYATVSYL